MSAQTHAKVIPLQPPRPRRTPKLELCAQPDPVEDPSPDEDEIVLVLEDDLEDDDEDERPSEPPPPPRRDSHMRLSAPTVVPRPTPRQKKPEVDTKQLDVEWGEMIVDVQVVPSPSKPPPRRPRPPRRQPVPTNMLAADHYLRRTEQTTNELLRRAADAEQIIRARFFALTRALKMARLNRQTLEGGKNTRFNKKQLDLAEGALQKEVAKLFGGDRACTWLGIVSGNMDNGKPINEEALFKKMLEVVIDESIELIEL